MTGSSVEECLICKSTLTKDGQCPVCDQKSNVSSSNGTDSENSTLVEAPIAEFQLVEPEKAAGGVDNVFLVDKANNKRYAVSHSVCKIGRDNSNDIAMPDDHYVSRHHARVLHVRNDFYLEDLGSTNGTLLNGAPVKERKELRAGDKITVGKVVYTFVIE